jgi:hypothetical protein
MTDLDTYELFNVDPDEISDVLVKIQKSFGFQFGDTELKDVKTFGELCDINLLPEIFRKKIHTTVQHNKLSTNFVMQFRRL